MSTKMKESMTCKDGCRRHSKIFVFHFLLTALYIVYQLIEIYCFPRNIPVIIGSRLFFVAAYYLSSHMLKGWHSVGMNRFTPAAVYILASVMILSASNAIAPRKEKTVVQPLVYGVLTYDCNSEYAQITGQIAKSDEIIIPSEIEGRTVSSIFRRAFKDSTVKKVYIPSSVKDVSFDAFFHCRRLKSVIMEDGVEVISGAAFSSCPSLESVRIPASVIFMDSFCFEGSPKVALSVDKDSYAEEFAKANNIPYELIN